MISDALNGNCVKLYRLHSSDAAEIAEAARDSFGELAPWFPWCEPDYSTENANEFIQASSAGWDNQSQFVFAIRDNDGQFVGTCALNEIHPLHRRANLGYWLRTSEWGKGYATEAASIVAAFGIEQLDLARVEIVVEVTNRRSQRVAERVGARREGVLTSRLVIGESARDAVMYSITR